MNSNEISINKGDFVQVIVNVWGENETPTVKNFYEGKVIENIQCKQAETAADLEKLKEMEFEYLEDLEAIRTNELRNLELIEKLIEENQQ